MGDLRSMWCGVNFINFINIHLYCEELVLTLRIERNLELLVGFVTQNRDFSQNLELFLKRIHEFLIKIKIIFR